MNLENENIVVVDDNEVTLVPEKKSSPNTNDRKRPCAELTQTETDCSICMEKWTNFGEHRIVSLKCGHLYGKVCIERWLKEKGAASTCPQCKQKASARDIRPLFAVKISSVDTAELEEANQLLAKEKRTNKQLLDNQAQLTFKYQQALLEIDSLNVTIRKLNKRIASAAGGNQVVVVDDENTNNSPVSDNSLAGKYELISSYEFTKSPAGSRVISYNRHLDTHVVSAASPSETLFPGYGVLKFKTVEFYHKNNRISEFCRIHSQPIRDLTFHDNCPNLILTCSIDKTLKLTDLSCNSVALNYSLDCPIWSCHWDVNNDKLLYAGLSNGEVCCFDSRNTSDALERFSGYEFGCLTNRSPILSIKNVCVTNFQNANSNVLCSSLNGMLVKNSSGMLGVRTSSSTMPIMSVSTDISGNHVLLTQRPGGVNNNNKEKSITGVKHFFGRLVYEKNADSVQMAVVHEFTGGKSASTLSKSVICEVEGQMAVIAGDEHTNTVSIFDAGNGCLHQKITDFGKGDVIIDVHPFCIGNGGGRQNFFTCLSNSGKASLYRFVASNFFIC